MSPELPSESTRAWLERRKTTNVLLGTNTVVLAAGFLSLGNVSSWAIQAVSEFLLVLILFTAIGLVFAGLFVQQ